MHLSKSRNASAVGTTSLLPFEDTPECLDSFPGWILKARAMPVNAAISVVTM